MVPSELAFRPSFRRMYIGLGILLVTCTSFSAVMFLSSGLEATDFLFAPPFLALPAVFSIVVSVPLILRALRTTYSNKYTINDEGIVAEEGLINKKTRSIPIANIDNIMVERPLLSILFSSGNICVDTPGGTGYEMVLKNIPVGKIKAVVEGLEGQMKKDREEGMARSR